MFKFKTTQSDRVSKKYLIKNVKKYLIKNVKTTK